ncbi:hypothetical protein ACSVC9_11765 [Clostridium sp. LBM24168]
MFPKSIGEFKEQEFKKVQNIFSNTEFKEGKIYIAASLRAKNNSDIERLCDLISIMIDTHGYKIGKDTISKIQWDNIAIISHIPSYEYEGINQYLLTLK